jgi:hypothetical protein
MKTLSISSKHSNPLYYVNEIKNIFLENDYIILSALEHATVIAIDAALILEKSNFAIIEDIKTSYINIKSKVTKNDIQRANIKIILKKY